MEPCEGVCKFSKSSKKEYDGSRCGCLQCPNYAFCKTWAMPTCLEYNTGRCGRCNVLFGKNLVFRQAIHTDACPICLGTDHTIKVLHPSGCRHATCLACFTYQWRPPLPKAIKMPEAYGLKHKCALLSESIALWKTNSPAEYDRWLQDTQHATAEFLTDIRARADPSKCPVCRKGTGRCLAVYIPTC